MNNEIHERTLTQVNNGIIFFGGIDVNKAIELMMKPFTVSCGFANSNLEVEMNTLYIRKEILKKCPEFVRSTK